MGFQLRVLAERWLERNGVVGGGGFRECQLRAELGCGGAGSFVWIIQCDTRKTKAD